MNTPLLLSLPPLSLYIHIPWCERKCPYCDFNSHVEKSGLPESAYIACLKKDLDAQLRHVQGRRLKSIFIGGGTPSLFSAASIGEILTYVRDKIPADADLEVTLEANPGSAEAEKFAGLFCAGINRLSIGIQSFDDGCLQKLGRIHSSANAKAAVKMAQEAGFTRINIDLMHGLPDQSQAMALADLQQAIELGVEHISWYQLTIEQNTEFYRYPPRLPDDDVLADIQDAGFALLKDNGFCQYEISAFCKNQQYARHNLNYWQFGDYLAIGAGAHGKLTHIDDGNVSISRFNNTRNPDDYIKRAGMNAAEHLELLQHKGFIAKTETIDAEDILFEALMNCLRLNDGMKLQDFLRFTGVEKSTLMTVAEPSVSKGLLHIGGHVRATDLGRKYLNSLLEALLSA